MYCMGSFQRPFHYKKLLESNKNICWATSLCSCSTQTLASQLDRSTPFVSTPKLITPWFKRVECDVGLAPDFTQISRHRHLFPSCCLRSLMFRRSKQSYGNSTGTIANDPDDWDDLDRLDRVESGRSCKFWSNHMETLSDDWDDQDDHFYSSNRE